MENNILDLLYDLKIEEKNSKKLIKIPDNFYETVKKEIILLRNEIQDSFLKQETDKYGNLSKRLANIENIYKEIVKLRLEKLTLLILNNQFMTKKSQVTDLAQEEEIFFETLQNFLESNKFYETSESGKKVEVPEIKEKVEVKKEINNNENESILLVILSNRIISDAQRDYTLQKGDVLYISRELANLLIKSKIAEELSINI